MLHLGDITKINGAQAPVVDCVIGGSPCQDLSVAGKRAGLAGERSGLFMEQIRIIKEMREADALRRRSDDDVRPRYMVWENVPGAFSSNGGKDFAAVLEETVRIIEPEAPHVSVPEKGWPTAGCLMGERWSIAWRVLDAQFWGVPQRRRRIVLVCDFNGHNAPWIVFGDSEQDRRNSPVGYFGEKPRSEISAFPEGLPGHPEPGEAAREEAAGGSGTGADSAGATNVIPIHDQATRFFGKHGDKADGKGNGLGIGNPGDPMNTLTGGDRHAVSYNILLDDQGGQQISVRTDGKSPTLRAEMHGNIPCVINPACFDARGNGNGKVVNTITGDHNNRITDYTTLVTAAYGIGNGQANQSLMEESVGTLNCMHDQQAVLVPKVAHSLKAKANCDYREDSETYIVAGLDCRNARENGDLCGTLQSKPNGGFSYNCIHTVRINNIVRRLTPLECERLQGFPDGWTDIGDWVDSKGKKHKAADSPRYKALGNSIAIPPWKWVLKRLCACYERDATMASLFDGIGGFPYIWEQLNGKGSCLWASEIDEFPMAVTKVRFGDDNS